MTRPEWKLASDLANQALELASCGEFQVALQPCRDAVALAESTNHYSLSVWRGQLAATLLELGRHDEALQHYQQAVSDALAHDKTDAASTVVTARYFLAENLLANEAFPEALAAVAPSVGIEATGEYLLRLPQALALWNLNRHHEARVAAAAALAGTRTDAQRATFNDRLRIVLSHQPSGPPDAAG